MGYRHIMISDTMVPKKEDLPEWFVGKWEKVVDFSGSYWRTYDEYKMYMTLASFPEDCQKLLSETDESIVNDLISIQLVFFADEGLTCNGMIDVIHTTVSRRGVKEVVLHE